MKSKWLLLVAVSITLLLLQIRYVTRHHQLTLTLKAHQDDTDDSKTADNSSKHKLKLFLEAEVDKEKTSDKKAGGEEKGAKNKATLTLEIDQLEEDVNYGKSKDVAKKFGKSENRIFTPKNQQKIVRNLANNVPLIGEKNIANSTLKNGSSSRTTNISNLIHMPVFYTNWDLWRLLEQKADVKKLSRGCGSVPKIIHQIWMNNTVPGVFHEFLESWVKVHPDWEYWYWTDALADEFIAKRYPQHINMFRNYVHGIQRADALRYFILYEFGGLYADMDLKALKSFNDLIGEHSALIPEDHAVHRFVEWGRPHIALNALMFSIPKHPLMKLVLERLVRFDQTTSKWEILRKTGPFMLDQVLELYQRSVVNSTAQGVPICESVYRPQHDQFIPTFDLTAAHIFRDICAHAKRTKIYRPIERLKWCNYLEANNYTNPANATENAYTFHAFVHVYVKQVFDYHQKKAGNLQFHVDEVAPKRRNISDVIASLRGADDSIVVMVIPKPTRPPVSATFIVFIVGFPICVMMMPIAVLVCTIWCPEGTTMNPRRKVAHTYRQRRLECQNHKYSHHYLA